MDLQVLSVNEICGNSQKSSYEEGNEIDISEDAIVLGVFQDILLRRRDIKSSHNFSELCQRRFINI